VWSPSNTPLSYTNWYPGEPNNSGGREACLEFNFQNSGKWNDAFCPSGRKYVCQTACPVPPSSPPPPPSPPSSPSPPPASKFAVITATQNAETLPYGPGPIGTKPAYFCTDCIGSPSDSWIETVACDGSNVDMTIVYQFDSAMSVVGRMRQCSATSCNVSFTVYGPGITTTSFNSDWWFTDRTVLPSTSGSRVSSDDGMWGGAPGEVNGDGQCYGNTGTTGFYGFGNCNSRDKKTGIKVYYGPNGSKRCPSLKAQLYATPN
jgi:hypothetical protein